MVDAQRARSASRASETIIFSSTLLRQGRVEAKSNTSRISAHSVEGAILDAVTLGSQNDLTITDRTKRYTINDLSRQVLGRSSSGGRDALKMSSK